MKKSVRVFGVALLCVVTLMACGEDASPDEAGNNVPNNAGNNDVNNDAPNNDAPNNDVNNDAPNNDAPNNDTPNNDVNNDPNNDLPDGGMMDDDAGVPDGGMDDPDADPDPVPPTFEQLVVDGQAGGAAFVKVVDLNGDGKLDLVLSAFGTLGLEIPNGTVTAYLQGDSLQSWTKVEIMGASQGVKFPNTVSVADLDGDDDLDVIVPSGFLVCTVVPFGRPCGGLSWYEQDGQRWVRHDILAPGQELFYHHAELVDFDGDGIEDLVTVGETKAAPFSGQMDRAEAQWFKGTRSAERFESTPRVIGAGLGSIPTVRDMDGDGDLDVASAEFFHPGGSFAWFERVEAPGPNNPAGRWQRHVIADDLGPSIMLGFVPDLLGDGVTRAVGSNHSNTSKTPPDPWESGIYLLDPPQDPRQPWGSRLISEGIASIPGSIFAPQAAPGIFGHGDIDGDGDVDLLVSGDGDPRVLWLEQRQPGTFVTHVLEEGLAQAGGQIVADLDGDGQAELVVTGYEANAIYVYRRR